MRFRNTSFSKYINRYKFGKRIKKYLRSVKYFLFGLINIFFFSVRSVFYLKNIFYNSKFGVSENYVKFSKKYHSDNSYSIKPVAFYLPQFHPVPENDNWWGRGFTEWTNVSRAVPQFVGHYQPRLPGDLGFYDLRLDEVQKQQIQIAINYGIEGFCYYYYWFGGKRILEMPVERHLLDKSLNFNYCLCWANENWTRTWDGGENEILIAQRHSSEDDVNFIKSLIPHFEDERYLRCNGRPMLLVYRPDLLPDTRETVARWRDYCRKVGVGEIFLLVVHSRDVIDPRDIDFDGAVEFPPGGRSSIKALSLSVPFVNPWHKGKIFDYNELKQCFLSKKYQGFSTFRGIMTGWDNEARRPGGGRVFINSTPESFGDWFEKCCRLSCQDHADSERYVFINAWNEWAEGTYLEPDRRYGYAYIDQIYRVLQNFIISKRG